jgi:hypothetical protein
MRLQLLTCFLHIRSKETVLLNDRAVFIFHSVRQLVFITVQSQSGDHLLLGPRCLKHHELRTPRGIQELRGGRSSIIIFPLGSTRADTLHYLKLSLGRVMLPQVQACLQIFLAEGRNAWASVARALSDSSTSRLWPDFHVKVDVAPDMTL